MPTTPDSMLEAAKKVSVILGVPWTDLQKVYRDSQANNLAIPKSHGRNIWLAHPRYIGRLIVAAALKWAGMSAHDAFYFSRSLTPEGRDMLREECGASGGTAPFECELMKLLSPQQQTDVQGIEFAPDEKRITIIYDNGANVVYRPAQKFPWPAHRVVPVEYEEFVKAAAAKDMSSALVCRSVLSGEAISQIREAVLWCDDAVFPVEHGSDRLDEGPA